jgi:hypothetical protein
VTTPGFEEKPVVHHLRNFSLSNWDLGCVALASRSERAFRRTTSPRGHDGAALKKTS